MTEANPYPSDWLRGVLSLAVRRLLLDGPTYGYAIAVGLEEQGFGKVKGGTLYPLLARLEEAGHVTTTWQAGDGGPGRKFYNLTLEGRAAFALEAKDWAEFADRVTSFITHTQHTHGGTP